MKRSDSKKFNGRVIMDQVAIDGAIGRIAEEIVKSYRDDDMIALVGIRTGGIHLAQRLLAVIQEQCVHEVLLGTLDINLYRDDLVGRFNQPVLRTTDIRFDVANRNIILVDDVLFTGRTIRAAMDGVIDLGRPARIQLAILVDRGHRELPIAADFIGQSLVTKKSEMVKVCLHEEGHPADAVVLSS